MHRGASSTHHKITICGWSTRATGRIDTEAARTPAASGRGDSGATVHYHNYYGGQQFGDRYVNNSGVQNVGGTLSIGQSGGSVGGGNLGYARSGGIRNSGGGNSGGNRQYGKPTAGQYVKHVVMNSTVNGKSLNDHVFHATGEHFEQHDDQGRRIGDVHSDARKGQQVNRHIGRQNAAADYHDYHEQMRQQRQAANQRLSQQFQP